jgi:hypothetical protein
MKHRISLGLLPIVAMIALTGCDSRPAPDAGYEERPRKREVSTTNPGGAQKQKQADFLNRVRSADPQKRTIERAILNERNELGLILDRSVQLDDIPKLMRGLLKEMAQAFPGEDLTIIAYAPSNPPRKIGTGRLDARTRDMTYTPET